MKVVLLEDVYNQGVAGEIVEVAPGFGRNYLIPRGMAVKATPGALRQFENLSKQAEVRRAEREKQAEILAEKIEETTLYFGVKAGENEKLYGSVTTADVADGLKEELGLEIDRRRVGDQPLRELGLFEVPVRLDGGFAPTVKVVVHREGEDPRAAEAEMEAEAEAAEEAAELEAEAEAAEMEAEADADAEAEAAGEDASAEAAAEPVDEGEPVEEA
jgi:large subunit ribosomal protein L9